MNSKAAARDLVHARVRALRIERGLTLADIEKATGFSVSLLSKLENGKISLTYDKLAALAMALRIDIAELLATDDDGGRSGWGRRILTRGGEGREVATGAYLYRYLGVDLLDKRFTPIWGEIVARSVEECGGFSTHNSDEFIYVLNGVLELHTDTYAPSILRAGDSLYFDGRMAHAYVASGDEPCHILSICSKEG
ncbi:MAG: XRE family transcriptional regulator [Pseudomonadota bacterium]|uniref:helix-turn-helix domain-containing protein n=1 Tax=Sphingomonas sp. ERG5 TaxID=1381597 RepID=UPI00068DEEC1|nr:XRE family transcriptional regulator [Sphingomonas sp. ERG5]